MAYVLSLVKRTDGAAVGADVNSVDLAPWLAEDGWDTQTAGDRSGGGTVDEAITLNIKDSTSDDNLSDSLQALEQKFREVEWARSVREANGVWLRTKLANESKVRQAFITAVRTGDLKLGNAQAKSSDLLGYLLGLTRRAAWEATAKKTITAGSVNLLGGTLSYSSVAGDVPARVMRLMVEANGSISEFWIGVKSSRLGVTPANFQPWWPLRLATNYGDDTTGGTSHVDATAKSGYTVITTFATNAALAQRVRIYLNEAVTSNAADQRGRYLVLLRAKNSAGSTQNYVRLRWGGGLTYNTLTKALVNQTFWQLYHLGEIDLPTLNNPPGYSLGTSTFYLDAENTAGNGDLVLDGLLLIPALDGSLHCTSEVGLSFGTPAYLEIFERPSGDHYAHSVNAGGAPEATLQPEPSLWGIEPGSGVIVCAAQDIAVGSSLTTTATVTLDVYERWLALRGTDGV